MPVFFLPFGVLLQGFYTSLDFPFLEEIIHCFLPVMLFGLIAAWHRRLLREGLYFSALRPLGAILASFSKTSLP